MNRTAAKPATESVEGFEVESAAAESPAVNAETPVVATVAPEKTADVVKEQIAEKTAADAGQRVDAKAAVKLSLVALEEKLAKLKNHVEGIALWKEYEAFKPTTKLEQAIKKAVIHRVREWIYAVQNGPAVPVIGANELATLPGLKSDLIQRERVEYRARGDRDIADLQAENEKLRAQLAELTGTQQQ